jgi:hypothetical protein
MRERLRPSHSITIYCAVKICKNMINTTKNRRSKVNGTVEALDKLSTWTVWAKTCIINSELMEVRTPWEWLERSITFGASFISTFLALISTIPESSCPSLHALWRTTSSILVKRSNNVLTECVSMTNQLYRNTNIMHYDSPILDVRS